MVYYHRSIPLTVSLREERAAGNGINEGQEFLKLLSSASACLHGSCASSNLDEAWDYEYKSLWEEKFGSQRFKHLPPKSKIWVLNSRTYWYRRLKPNMKRMMRTLLLTEKGTLHLKEILHTADAIISSLIVTFPECLKVSDDPADAYKVTDRIINNVISNCLFDYAGYQRDLKRFKKGLRKAAFERLEYRPAGNEIRKLSWVADLLKIYNPMAASNSKAKMFRVCGFTQTRATGLANNKMCETTINEFIDEVSTVREFSPDLYLQEAIEFVAERISIDATGVSPHFRMSVSTSACVESSKKDEGKFGHIKRRFDKFEFEPLPRFSVDNPGGQIGNQTFREAREMIKRGDPIIWKTNVAAIRENGKCRVVTAGSFYKDAFLQPFSHMTIEALKSDPLLRDGFQAARLGYKFLSGIDHRDPVRGLVLFEEDVRILSFDWTKATDRPSHASGHATMGALLRAMKCPPDLLRDILAIWPGKKDIYVGGKYRCRLENGIPMGDPLTKTNLSLAHPICVKYADLRVGEKIIRIGAGNGDDGVEIVTGPRAEDWIGYFLDAAKQLGYDLSKDDTFVTRDWFTYCEEVMMLPIDRFHTVSNANRMKDHRLSPYLDLPKFRLVVDTRKDRRDFSSDPKGKYTLLGKDMEYVRREGHNELVHLFAVASACQDVCLGLRYQKVPVYLPRQIYGIGKVPPNWNPVSWANAIWSQRPHQRNVIFTSMRELLGKRGPTITKLRGVLSREAHFDKESYIEIHKIPVDDPIRRFRCVAEDEWKLFPGGVLDKLRRTGRLVPESKIAAHYLFQERIQSLSQDQHADLFETIKGMSIELDSPADKDQLVSLITEFKRMYEFQPYHLAAERQEDLYPANIVKILADSDPLRVDVDWDYLSRFVKRPRADNPFDRGVDRLEEWFDNNYEDVIAGREYELPPTDVIEDDPIILLRAERSDAGMIVIITNDYKLVNLTANKLVTKLIAHISVETWFNHDADERAFTDALKERTGILTYEFIVDEGAIETFLLKTDIQPTKYPSWTESVERSKIRSQADIYDVYLPPKPITAATVLDLVKIKHHWRGAVNFLSTR